MMRDCQYNTQLTFDSHNLHKTLISSALLPPQLYRIGLKNNLIRHIPATTGVCHFCFV